MRIILRILNTVERDLLEIADAHLVSVFLKNLPDIFSSRHKDSRVSGTREFRFYDVPRFSEIPYVVVTTGSSSFSDGVSHEYRNIIKVLHGENADFEKEVRETLASIESKKAFWISGEELKERIIKAFLEGRIVYNE